MIYTIIIFLTYQLLQLVILPFLPIYLTIRKIKGKPVLGNLKERNGFIHKNTSNKKTIWLHAVSVGEILSVQNFIDQIKEKIPNSCCYVTTGTRAGKKTAIKNLNADYISFLPYDYLLPMFLAFKRIKPNSLIIIEAETWPNLIFIAKWLHIPIYMLNARISKRSQKKYFKFEFLFKNLLKKFNLILTQSQNDTELFQQLGVSKKKIQTLGNIKTFNVLFKKNKIKQENISHKYPTLLLGSIHPRELNIFLNLYKKLKNDFSNLKMIIAPRHFHWKKQLRNRINYSFHLWEKDNQLKEKTKQGYNNLVNKIFKTNDILLVCKLGELFNLYQTSDIFFLGGTFTPIGGHNLLEPAAWSKPSIIGPYYQNTKNIADKLEQLNGLIKIKNESQLYMQTKKLLNNNTLTTTMGNNANNWLKKESQKVQSIINNFFNIL